MVILLFVCTYNVMDIYRHNIDVWTYVLTYVRTCTYVHMNILVYKEILTYSCTYVRTYVAVQWICTLYMCTYVCMYVCTL